ncbi:Wadjet anti-phage system protein JetA family protein [Paenibacillus sp. J2TS4]|uniref:Wadjet anti-phage system protein JetA family protein n=1 Tax=Paenibacillus sp. J2TS4 TaxID=2807194 RepID=UPI001B013E58|nr:Wadjet anti-phage system protein JetA family protein [Paenibacillus sp. J2TS4]GIP33619.1 hypothetical protein J2TS4_28290 [Paenibacillus sp. J2TS4]
MFISLIEIERKFIKKEDKLISKIPTQLTMKNTYIISTKNGLNNVKLFDVIPEGLFLLLTGSNKQIYAEILLLLYENIQAERFGIRYDVMRDLIQELLETHIELGLSLDDMNDEQSESIQGTNNQTSVEESARIKANAILRRLETMRWLSVETRSQFDRYLVLPHYASKLIGLFKELCDAKTVEYQRFAFLIYQSLSGEAARHQPCSAILGAADISSQFRQELIALYNNMKAHMEQVILKTSIQDVLDHHFEQYKSQIVDKSYHRLKTSDHVARYRMQILHTVQQWLLNSTLMEEAALDGVKSGLYEALDEARRAIRQALFFIEETFLGLDELFYQIDVRHNQYLRSSFERARYLSQQNEGTEQQIVKLLGLLSQFSNFSEADTIFSLRQVKTLQEQSLLPPRRMRVLHQPETHIVVDLPEHVRNELKEKSAQKMRKAVTRKKVNDYVLQKLDGRRQMELVELAPQSAEEYILLGYIYLYGSDGGSVFHIQRNPGRQILVIGNYRFNNHTIKRRGRGYNGV